MQFTITSSNFSDQSSMQPTYHLSSLVSVPSVLENSYLHWMHVHQLVQLFHGQVMHSQFLVSHWNKSVMTCPYYSLCILKSVLNLQRMLCYILFTNKHNSSDMFISPRIKQHWSQNLSFFSWLQANALLYHRFQHMGCCHDW